MKLYLLVALFGAAGSSLRYFLFNITPKIYYSHFPIGTITVNLLGSFFIGLVISLFDKGLVGENLRVAIIIAHAVGCKPLVRRAWLALGPQHAQIFSPNAARAVAASTNGHQPPPATWGQWRRYHVRIVALSGPVQRQPPTCRPSCSDSRLDGRKT